MRLSPPALAYLAASAPAGASTGGDAAGFATSGAASKSSSADVGIS